MWLILKGYGGAHWNSEGETVQPRKTTDTVLEEEVERG